MVRVPQNDMTVQILQLLTGQALDSPCKGEASQRRPEGFKGFLEFLPLVSGLPMQERTQAHVSTRQDWARLGRQGAAGRLCRWDRLACFTKVGGFTLRTNRHEHGGLSCKVWQRHSGGPGPALSSYDIKGQGR